MSSLKMGKDCATSKSASECIPHPQGDALACVSSLYSRKQKSPANCRRADVIELLGQAIAAPPQLAFEQLMANLAAGQIADDLAALRAALGLASNLEFGSWTVDHNEIPHPFGPAEQRIHDLSDTSSPGTALNQSPTTSASLSPSNQSTFN